MSMPRRHTGSGSPPRWRAGQVTFLEFAATLPIFCILFMAMMTFHRYYTNTRFAHAQARLISDVNKDDHHSGLKAPSAPAPDIRDMYQRKNADPLAQGQPAVNHLMVNEYETVYMRKSGAHGWFGTGDAAGYHRTCRDNWTHFDIRKQIDRDQPGGMTANKPQESMPFIFHSPTGGNKTMEEFLRL